MYRHFLTSGLKQILRSPGLALLVVSIVGLGIGLAMAAWTSVYILAKDPIPEKSDRLFRIHLDPRRVIGEEVSPYLTRLDAETLLRDGHGARQTMVAAGPSMLRIPNKDGAASHAVSRYTTTDFFSMFLVPIVRGRVWTRQEESSQAQVALIDKGLSEKLFGTPDSVGRDLVIDGFVFRIIGITDSWRPIPRFYDLSGDHFRNQDQLFIPFTTALGNRLNFSGELSCWADVPSLEGGGDPRRATGAPCSWVGYWVELTSPSDRNSYRAYLENYARHQNAIGRFLEPENVRMQNVREWLRSQKIVPRDVWIQSWVATGLLILAIVNASGLILTIFMRRRHEIAIRRAIGASRASIFAQFMIEAGLLGSLGAGLSIMISILALWILRQQPYAYAGLARMNLTMFGTTLLAALTSMLLAGAFPSWRAMRVPPATSLKQGA